MTYRERRERKAERLREWADKRETKAAAAFAASNRISDGIPFGQPILVGHHSEKRHRRDIDRIHSGMSRGIENSRKADEFRSRADNIESAADRAIYSDDEDAIEWLKERIASLEATRARIKAYNATCKKGARDASILLPAEQEELLVCLKYAAFQCPGGRFPQYVTANLSGNIKRQRDRLAMLQKPVLHEVAS